MICKHCGKEIDEKETCCPHCFKYTEKGELALTRLAGMKPPSKRTNEPAFGYAEDGHHTARHTCKQCGKILRDGAQVCPDCGTQTELATPTGIALLKYFTTEFCRQMPVMTVLKDGGGMGTKNIGRPNIFRAVLGEG